MKNKFQFQFENEDGKIIDCELILSFYNKKYNKNFLLFTDNTKDAGGSINTYAYYEEKSDSSLVPVIEEAELKLVKLVYDSVKEELTKFGD